MPRPSAAHHEGDARLLRSVRVRLATVTMVLLVGLVVGMGTATLVIGLRSLDDSVDLALGQAASEELASLGGELPSSDSGEPTEQVRGSSDTFFLVLDASGGVVYNSGVPQAGLPDLAALASARSTGRDLRTVTADAREIRLLTLRVPAESGAGGWLQAGFDLTLHDRQSQGLVLAVVVVGAASLAAAGLVTYLVTGRALVPIRSAFATERRFVADASHEIRTPAAIIRSSAEVLQREALVEPAGRPLVEDIVAEADRLGRLVDELLGLAASQRGALAVDRRPLDAVEVARSTVRRAGALAAERGLTLAGPADGAAPLPVQGDADRLVQLLLVLVDNAMRHSPAGGTVTVSAAGAGRHAEIAVSDQGPGVPVDAREAIFEPFARVAGGRALADEGSGLGLAIARRLAQLHGGNLTVGDAPGGGARFVLSLPLR